MSCFAVTATATRPHGKRATTRDRTQTTSSSHHGGTSSPIRGDDKKTKASVSLPGGKLHLGNDSWRRTAAGIAAGAYLSMTTAMALPAPAGATFLDDMQEPSIMGLTLKPRVQEVILESKSDHIGEDFSGLDLQGAIYAECDLRDSDFSHSDLRAIIFSRAIMPNVNFEGSDMQSAFLDYVVLRGANFRNVIATNANFTRSDLGAGLSHPTRSPDCLPIHIPLIVCPYTLPKLATVVHTSRYTRSAKGALRKGRDGYSNPSYYGVQGLPFPIPHTNPRYTRHGQLTLSIFSCQATLT